ncbi:Ubiquitin-60S ribosomal protein L40 [Armadillidium nasatum]|uniref:Ubiquitin-60S ribosomal protein L40 n=1 Tax=Armadillidium nasatum TaxID=96803 RepID=A0A5N5TC10_9CRUS|nr:Ubiquitin-60S ribosomal protein L40 [Armadillidium nasatum]
MNSNCPICGTAINGSENSLITNFDTLSVVDIYNSNAAASSIREIVTEEKMQIFVIDFEGKTVTLEVKASDTVTNLKETIKARLGIPAKYQRLIYGSTIQLTSRQLGGAKKRKKNYSTPKKVKLPELNEVL